MGMKSAACWFAPRWRVRTCAFGESVARTVRFDIENIVNDNIEETGDPRGQGKNRQSLHGNYS